MEKNKPDFYKENIKSLFNGYLITLFIVIGTMIVNLIIFISEGLIKEWTNGSLTKPIPDWFMTGFNIITGIFALLTLFTIFLFQFIELILMIWKKIKQ